MGRILVVDDEVGIREFIGEALELDGHVTAMAADGTAALAEITRSSYDLVITDLKMPGLDGMELLNRVKTLQPEVEVVVLTAHGSIGVAVDAMKSGAFDFMQKPPSGPEELRLLVRRALERRALLALKEERSRDDGHEPDLTSVAPASRGVVTALRRVAATDATVLLVGESGTGKEVAARSVHRWSSRVGAPFVAVNCAALSEQLLESELFGHERGAFTGATAARRGRIELAEGGTLFLDEVAELQPALQAKLLRVLQEGCFERLGGERTMHANVRWIAATNRDLESMVGDGRFRTDLFHRLAVFPVRMPPLRERREDISPLIDELLARIGAALGRPGLELDPVAAAELVAADWPGNVRELRNVLERAAILAGVRRLGPEHIVLRPLAMEPVQRSAELAGTLESLERIAVMRALASTGGNRRRAAQQLGIGLRTLYDKLKKHSIS